MIVLSRSAGGAGRRVVLPLALLVLSLFVAPSALGAVQTAVFHYADGQEAQFQLPPGVTEVHVEVIGGHGGWADHSAMGGAGGTVSGDLTVEPNQVFSLVVGGYGGRGGGKGWGKGGGEGQAPYGNDGRGGGGASAVFLGTAAGPPLLVGGGGGGGGGDSGWPDDYGGAGGAGGSKDGTGQNGHASTDDATSGGCGGCKSARDGDRGSHDNHAAAGGGGGGGGGYRAAHGGDGGTGGGGGGGGSSHAASQVTNARFGVGEVKCQCHGQIVFRWTDPSTSRVVAQADSSGQAAPAFTSFAQPLRAQVTDEGGAPVVGETVAFDLPSSGPGGTFAIGAATHAEAVTGDDGIAVSPVVVAGADVGTWSATASVGRESARFSLTNEPVRTVTTVSSSAETSRFGQAVSFTAHVSAAAGAVGGHVQFSVDGVDLGAPVAVTGGVAHAPAVASLDVASHQVLAEFTGTGPFASSEGVVRQVVQPAATAVTLTASDTSVDVGDPVSFGVQVDAVAPGSGMPAGTVEVAVDGAVVATPALDASGHASVPFTPVAAGAHGVTARYLPDGASFAAGAAQLGLAVGSGTSATTLTASADPIEFGQPVTLTARVDAVDTIAPSGLVTFHRGADEVCAETLTVIGGTAQASCVVAAGTLAPGADQPITAVYGGAAGIAPSSAQITQTVVPAATTTALAASPEPSGAGAPITLRATVARVHAGSGPVVGEVQFGVGSRPIGAPVAVDAFGVAELVVDGADLPAPGDDLIRAAYGGSTAFDASSAAIVHHVDRGVPSLSLRSSADPAVIGTPVRFGLTLPAGATRPVQFYADGQPLGLPVAAGDDGTAISPPATLAVGAHEIQASYPGDGTYEPARATLVQMVVSWRPPVVTDTTVPGGPLTPVTPTTQSSQPDQPHGCERDPMIMGVRRDARGRLQVVGWAGAGHTGAAVRISSDGRNVARAVVGRDGLFRATGRARAHTARYVATVAGRHSPAVRVSRALVVTAKHLRADGALVVAGRLGGRGAAGAALRLRRTPLCATAAAATVRTLRTDRHGRFRVVIAPVGPVALYTVVAGGGRASLPLLAGTAS